MSNEKSLQRMPAGEMAVAEQQPAPSVGMMLQAVIEKGVTAENVGAMEKLVDLYNRTEDRNAEKAFNSAFVALQAEMPKVHATKAVPNNDGSVRYKFAPYEDIMHQVQPFLLKHGFTVSFSSRFEGTRIIMACTLRHTAGHKQVNEFAARVGSGPPKANESQADGAASTYAKRFALCDALNIVVSHIDSDARLEGDHITKEQAEELERRVKMLNRDVKKFLAFAGGAESFETIRAAMYDTCDEMLTKAERQAR